MTTTVNAGRINLNGGGAQLKVVPNDPDLNSTSRLTNKGTIEFTSGGAAGIRSITGNLVNQGTILANNPEASFQFPGGTNTPPKLTNQETITVSAGNALRAISDAIVANASGGLVDGDGTVNISAQRLEIGANSQIGGGVDVNLGGNTALAFLGAAGAGNVDITSGTTPLSGNVPADFEIDISDSTLSAPGNYTNAGTIDLIGNSGLATEDGNAATTETLTNTGTLTTSGSAGIAALSGDLVNRGQITAGHSTTRFDQRLESRGAEAREHRLGHLDRPAGRRPGLDPRRGAGDPECRAPCSSAEPLLRSATPRPPARRRLTSSAPNHSIGIPAGSGAVSIEDGTLGGTGLINADVVNSGGTVAPGLSPGRLGILHNYTPGSRREACRRDLRAPPRAPASTASTSRGPHHLPGRCA